MRRVGALLALAAAAVLSGCGAGEALRARAQDLGAFLAQTSPEEVDAAAPAPIEAERPAEATDDRRLPRVLRPDLGPESPARVLVIGDSLSQGFGALLTRQARERGLSIDVIEAGRVSTGLARSDFYDWPTGFADLAATARPDIVVAHFGANDMQTIIRPEGRAIYGAPGWEPAYRAQIRRILDVALLHRTQMWWIGPAPDRGRNLNRHLERINPIFAEEAEAVGAVYYPLEPEFAGPDFAFVREISVDGRRRTVRTPDGSHFTGFGYGLVADRLLDDMVERFPTLDPRGPGGAALAFNLQ